VNILVIAAPVFVVLVVVTLVAASRRRDAASATGQMSRLTRSKDRGPLREDEGILRGKAYERLAVLERTPAGQLEKAPAAAPVPWSPPDADAIGVSRRQFLNRSMVGAMVYSLSGFGVSIIAFLWPTGGGGFGSKIRVGNLNDIKAEIQANNGFLYKPEGRMWITEYPLGAVEKAKAVYSPAELAGMEAGVVALYQKCPHLGCRVPECSTSQWFECPCHGSQYNQVGEKRGGPAPRGMDRFAMSVANNVLEVDTGTIIQGPPIGVNTTGQEAEGPHCIGGGAH
jgi:cytochrome b6-f complex iron-sulfur subunit